MMIEIRNNTLHENYDRIIELMMTIIDDQQIEYDTLMTHNRNLLITRITYELMMV